MIGRAKSILAVRSTKFYRPAVEHRFKCLNCNTLPKNQNCLVLQHQSVEKIPVHSRIIYRVNGSRRYCEVCHFNSPAM